MSSTVLVAGIDLSLRSTGLSCGGDQTTVCSSLSGVERLIDVSQRVIDYLKDWHLPPVVIEGYSFASRNSQAHSIGELGGVVRVALHTLGVPFVEIPPTVRAKFATGKGNAGKSEVVSAVSARTGIVWTGKGADDMCDAFVLEEMGLASLGAERFEWPKENMKVLDKIDWTELRRYYEQNKTN